MATEKLYYREPYLRESTARVLSCAPAKGGWEILLDRTIFYPTGGGQPCDLGTIGDAQVLEVSERGEDIFHVRQLIRAGQRGSLRHRLGAAL